MLLFIAGAVVGVAGAIFLPKLWSKIMGEAKSAEAAAISDVQKKI